MKKLETFLSNKSSYFTSMQLRRRDLQRKLKRSSSAWKGFSPDWWQMKASVLLQFIEFYHFIYLQIKHEAAAELVRRKSEPEHARTLKSLAAQEETAASSQGVESKRLAASVVSKWIAFVMVSRRFTWIYGSAMCLQFASPLSVRQAWSEGYGERERESLAMYRHQSSPKHVARCCKPLTLPRWSQWLGIQQSIAPIAASPSQLYRLARFAFLPELSLSQDGWLMAWEGGDYCRVLFDLFVILVFSFVEVFEPIGASIMQEAEEQIPFPWDLLFDSPSPTTGPQGSSGIFQIYAVRGREECVY